MVPTRARTLPPLAALLLASGAPALAQGVVVDLVLEGDAVPGVGNVTSIDNLAVQDGGAWIVEVDTDNPDTTIDGALIEDGALQLREGQALVAPAGASVGSFDALTLNVHGDSGWNLFLDNTGSTSDDSGIFFDAVLVIQEGDVSTAAGFTPGTPYIGFFETKFNAANQILIMASIDDPAITSTVDRALVIAHVDGSGGLISETVLHKEGDVLPGQVDAVADFATGPHGFDFDDAGSVLYIADLSGATTSDGVVYLDGTLLAQEGSPSPVAGRNWSSLSTSNRVALGRNGDWVHTGTLDGSTSDDLVIVKNGSLLRQEGDTLPDIAPFLLTGFGSAPVDVDQNGNVLWFGDWDDPDTTRDTGLFLNDTLLVQEGVSRVNGLLVQSLAGVQDAFALSDDGQYVLFEATLEGGLNGAFRMDLACPAPQVYCTPKLPSLAACVPEFVTVGAPSGSAGSGFDLAYGPVPGGNVGLFFYTTNGPAAAPVLLSYGWLCINGVGLFRLPAGGSGGTAGVCDGSYEVDFNLWVATQTADPALVTGALIDLQCWYRDPPNPGTANLSDALQFQLCP